MRGNVSNIEVKLKKGLRTVYRHSFSYEFYVVGNDFSCNDLIRTTVNQYLTQVKIKKRKDDMTGKYKAKMIPSDGIEVKKVK